MPESHDVKRDEPTGVVTEPASPKPQTAPDRVSDDDAKQVAVKLNPEADFDGGAFIRVPRFGEVEVTNSPTKLPAEHANALLETNFVVLA